MVEKLFEGTPPGNSREAYIRLLGRHSLPELPKDLPETIHLPSIFLGDLEIAIKGTARDHRERSQLISRNSKSLSPKGGRLRVGNEDSIGIKAAMIYSAQSFFRVPTLFFHTHPDAEAFTSFSHNDIASARCYPRSVGFIYIVASNLGVAGLFHTIQSRRLNRSSRGEILDLIFDMGFEAASQDVLQSRDHTSLAKIASNLGFGYYLGRNTSPKGIDFQKIV